jgi:hypothetical protein
MKLNFENRSDIVRDAYSNAVLTTNRAGYVAAKKRKEEQQRYIKLEQDVKELKNTLSDTNKMLKELLNRGIK